MAVGLLEKIDSWQQRYRGLAFGYAVQKKFSDDRGGYLAALITYYAFLSIFPLLLAVFTVVAYVLAGDKSAISTLEKHIGSYPIIGTAAQQLKGAKLHGSPLALVVGVGGLLWGATGLAQSIQFAMDEAWNIPAKDRPGFVDRLWRTFAWYAVFGLGIVASTFVAALGSWLHWSGGIILSTLGALVLNVALFLVSFWLLSPSVAVRDLLPGAIVAGAVWTFLTGIGIGLTHKLAHSNALYGTFGPVLGLLAFLYLGARITMYSVEAN
ncbi:MAG TPA: YhjD/YihY/BrkB family envelope integrity protein, partial [Acidimicrobiales bacterium]|nr:YhjD/YihY/BrkB family envelope integrity protein [Acidimicrobiales bacterium]